MMRKLWIKNTPEDRIAILQQAERAHSGVTLPAVEKDWWVTATLLALSRCACAPYLSFKGGTSLSKGFGLIERFSEDIDIALQHSFFGIEPINRSQRDKLRKVSRAYIHKTLSGQLDDELRQIGVYGYRIENVTQVSAKGGATKPIDSDKDPTTILVYYKTFAKWSLAEKAPLFRQGLCRMPQMQGTESEGEGSVLTHMTKPESRK